LDYDRSYHRTAIIIKATGSMAPLMTFHGCNYVRVNVNEWRGLSTESLLSTVGLFENLKSSDFKLIRRKTTSGQSQRLSVQFSLSSNSIREKERLKIFGGVKPSQ